MLSLKQLWFIPIHTPSLNVNLGHIAIPSISFSPLRPASSLGRTTKRPNTKNQTHTVHTRCTQAPSIDIEPPKRGQTARPRCLSHGASHRLIGGVALGWQRLELQTFGTDAPPLKPKLQPGTVDRPADLDRPPSPGGVRRHRVKTLADQQACQLRVPSKQVLTKGKRSLRCCFIQGLSLS